MCVVCGAIRLLSAAQWQHDKRTAVLSARRRHLEQTRQMRDAAELLRSLDEERRVFAQQTFNSWLQRRRLAAGPPVVDRLDTSSSALCTRNHTTDNSLPVNICFAYQYCYYDPAPIGWRSGPNKSVKHKSSFLPFPFPFPSLPLPFPSLPLRSRPP